MKRDLLRLVDLTRDECTALFALATEIKTALRSGKPYLPFGVLSFIPVVGRWVDRLLPPDSHARMHLDSAARGPMFEYAFEAAVKRTRWEYDFLARILPPALLTQFRDISG